MGNLTLLDLERDVLNRLNENYDSTVGDLRAGASGGSTIATITGAGSSAASTVKTLLNEASAWMARTCYPIPDTGTISFSRGQRTALIASATPSTAGNVLWAVRGAKWILTSYSDLAVANSTVTTVA